MNNLSKQYPRIANELYHGKWFIMASYHKRLVQAFEAHLAGVSRGAVNASILDAVENPAKGSIIRYATPKIAVITIEGAIGKRLDSIAKCMGGCDLNDVSSAIDTVMDDQNVTDIVFDFSTPGGTVTGMPEMADKIATISEIKNTIAYTDTLCASCGYYLASQCNTILTAPSADIGCVGVYSLYLDETAALAKEGLKVNAISDGKYKLLGASFKEMTAEERAILDADVKTLGTQFRTAVTSKRDNAVEDLQGLCYFGDTAVSKGFSDGLINSLDDLVEELTKQHLDTQGS